MFDFGGMRAKYSNMSRNGENSQCLFSFLTTTIPHGDSSYIVKPSKPVQDLTVRDAAGLLRVSVSSVYRLVDEGRLKSWRPLKGKILIPAGEIDRHRGQTADPEFWEGRQGAALHPNVKG